MSTTFSIVQNASHTIQPVVCYAPTMVTLGGAWLGENPLDYTLPLFLLQLLLVILITRATAVVIQPLHQPRYIAEIIGGIIMGPSMLGNVRSFSLLVFPLRSVLVLETLALLGVIYFMFIVGVETDMSMMRRAGRSVAFAVPCMAVPFAIGAVSGLALHEPNNQRTAFITLLGITLSVTTFSVMARTLADLKMLSSPVGATALSAAMLIDGCAWVLLAMAITLARGVGGQSRMVAMLCTLTSGMAFFAVCLMVVRPAVAWVAKRTPEGEEVDDLHACSLLVGVMVAAFAGDLIGIHAISGAFVYGLVIPNGPLGAALIERVEDFTEGLLLPLFFTMSGLRTDLLAIGDVKAMVFLALVVLVASAAKVAMCLLVSLYSKMPLREGFVIGLLMNTKGVIELVILNIGRDKGVLSNQSFSILVLMSVVVSGLMQPLLVSVVQSQRQGLSSYERRTVQWSQPDAELRMLVCVHTTRHVSTMIGLVDASHPTKRSPIAVHVLHLIELTGRASAMLVVHNSSRFKTNQSTPAGRVQAQSEHIVAAFDSYEQHSTGVSIQPLTAVSPFSTMHEDVCAVAENNGIALIVLPFHKQQTIDGGMEVTNPAIRSLNQAVLATAPCSVAIIVDRGLAGAARSPQGHHVALIFIGGPDDREALAFASRMAEHPDVSLTVLHLVPGRQPDDDSERHLDDECLAEFRLKMVSNESLVFKEEVANNPEDMVAAIRSVDSIHDVYVVGRGEGRESPLTAGLSEWIECPELGPVGDFLASADFGGAISVLVVQQSAVGNADGDAASMLSSPGGRAEHGNHIGAV